jgi:hypothetical protein
MEGGLRLKGKSTGGLWAKSPFFFPFLGSEQRMEGERPWTAGRRRLPASRAMATTGRWGKMEKTTRGIDSHPHLGSGRCEEAAPQAAADWTWR